MSRSHPSLPLWKEDVSFRAADERFVMRRQFGRAMALTSLGMFLGNLWILGRTWTRRLAPRNPSAVVVAGVSELAIGQVKVFAYPTQDDPCLLIRLSATSWVAYSQKCTHLSCAVVYESETGRLACPCHHGYFSAATGEVLQGPPPRRLPRVHIEPRGFELVAVGMEDDRA
ncbi:MAG TPA: Rieske 2Fe-2S domain-containing protein [Polyangia bacterium]|nr:Rieske 2Fe-2S domain-containing protein [Polyangia bacterium]